MASSATKVLCPLDPALISRRRICQIWTLNQGGQRCVHCVGGAIIPNLKRSQVGQNLSFAQRIVCGGDLIAICIHIHDLRRRISVYKLVCKPRKANRRA